MIVASNPRRRSVAGASAQASARFSDLLIPQSGFDLSQRATVMWGKRCARKALAAPPIRIEALRFAEHPIRITGKPAASVLMNGSLPGPTLRFRKSDEVAIGVTSTLKDDSSVHWQQAHH